VCCCFSQTFSKMARKHNAETKHHTCYGFKIGTKVPQNIHADDAPSTEHAVKETLMRGGMTESAARLFSKHYLEFGVGTAGIKPCEELKDEVNKIIQRECNIAFQEAGPSAYKTMMQMQAAAKGDKREAVKDKASGVGINEDEETQDPQETARTRLQKKAAEEKGEAERDVESVVELDATDTGDANEPQLTFGFFDESDDEGDVPNLTSMIMQLAAQPTTVIKTSQKERKFAAEIVVHGNEVTRVLLEVCGNSRNVNLKKAAKSFLSTPTTEIMRCATKYEGVLGVSPAYRVLWQRMMQCLNGNKSVAELMDHERTKLDKLSIVHTGSPNEDLATFSTKFNEQVKVVAATGSALSGEEQVSKFSKALQKAAGATSIYNEAFRFSLKAMRDGNSTTSADGSIKKSRQRQDPRRAEESDDESDSSPFGWGS